jgi:acetyltransferase-like isoleucine patch superfamily enzyme
VVDSGALEFRRFDMGISPFWRTASEEEKTEQRHWQSELCERGDVLLGAEVFVSQLAVVYPDRLVLGDRSYVSAHSYLWGDVEIGADCTLNPFTEVRGKIRIGDGVRIGAHTSILGFQHSTSTDLPVYKQPLTFAGIEIGDDVWIGSHVSILDGVRVGAHSIVGAGAVVTRDVEEWSVVAGNPARKIRDRRASAKVVGDFTGTLRRVSDTAAQELPGILAAAWERGEEQAFIDHPGASPSVRAWCDAVELSQLFEDRRHELPVTPAQIASELLSRQDPSTGLIPESRGEAAGPSSDGHAAVNYNILCAGYALRLLGASFAHPILAVDHMTSQDIRRGLDEQPWGSEGWRAGAWVDSLGTAMLWNSTDFGLSPEIESLMGWLVTRCNPATGLWGVPNGADGWLEPVNGFYRATRGTFAQFGVPLPHPERTIDSVLAHSADRNYFGATRGTACNVLDVIHPLWLAGKQTSHRRNEGESWARRQLERIGLAWEAGAGFSFALEPGTGWQRTPGLLGTEMWLSITWLLADYLGAGDVPDFRPRGIHRPEPWTTLAASRNEALA